MIMQIAAAKGFLADERGEASILRSIVLAGIVLIAVVGSIVGVSAGLRRASVLAVQPVNSAAAEIDSFTTDLRAASFYSSTTVSAFQVSSSKQYAIPLNTRRGVKPPAPLKFTTSGSQVDAVLTAPGTVNGAHVATPVVQSAPDFGAVTVSSATPAP